MSKPEFDQEDPNSKSMFDFLDEEAANRSPRTPKQAPDTSQPLPVFRKPVPVTESGALRAPDSGQNRSSSSSEETALTDSDDFEFLSDGLAAGQKPRSGNQELDFDDDWRDGVHRGATDYDDDNHSGGGNRRWILWVVSALMFFAGIGFFAVDYFAKPTQPVAAISEVDRTAGDDGDTSRDVLSTGDDNAVSETIAEAVPENALPTLGQRFRSELEIVLGLLAENRLDEAERWIETLDRSVFGYGAPEFEDILNNIEAIRNGSLTLEQALSLESTNESSIVEAEQAQTEQLATQQAEEERAAGEKAQTEQLATQQAEEERAAAEKAQAEQLATQQAEEERAAAEQAQVEQLAAQQAEEKRAAAEQAQAEQLAAQQAEEERAAAEKAQAEQLAAQQAEEERAAAEQAQAERTEAKKQRVAADETAAAEAEQARAAAREAARERAAALAAGRQAAAQASALANAESEAAFETQRKAATQLEVDRRATDREAARQRAARDKAQNDNADAVIETSRSISDDDLQKVYGNFTALEQAIENGKITDVIAITNRSGSRVQQFMQLFENSDSIEAKIANVATRSASGTITGTLRISQVTRADGTEVVVPAELSTIKLTSTRDGSGWSLIDW